MLAIFGIVLSLVIIVTVVYSEKRSNQADIKEAMKMLKAIPENDPVRKEIEKIVQGPALNRKHFAAMTVAYWNVNTALAHMLAASFVCVTEKTPAHEPFEDVDPLAPPLV